MRISHTRSSAPEHGFSLPHHHLPIPFGLGLHEGGEVGGVAKDCRGVQALRVGLIRFALYGALAGGFQGFKIPLL